MGRHQPPRDYSAHSDIESSEPTTKEPVALPTDPRPPPLPSPPLARNISGDAINVAVTADLTPSLTPHTPCVYIAHNSQDT